MFKKIAGIILTVLSVVCYATTVDFADVNLDNPVAQEQYVIPIETDAALLALNVKILVSGDAELVSVTGKAGGQQYGWDSDFSVDAAVSDNQAIIGLGTFSGSEIGTVAEVVVRYVGPNGYSVTMVADESYGGTFDADSAVNAQSVADTIQVGEVEDDDSEEPEIPAYDLSCETAGRYADNGMVEIEDESYLDGILTVTVVAVPDEGYRVQKWVGADGKYPTNSQTVTIKKASQRVVAYFEPIPVSKVSKAIFKAGKTRASSTDSFTITGVLGLSADDMPREGGALTVRILNEDGQELFNDELAYTDTGVKATWPTGISYVNKAFVDGNLNVCKFTAKSGALTIAAFGQDLSGWYSPLTLEVSLGDVTVSAIMSDGEDGENPDVINGRSFMPGVFRTGLADVVTTDSCSEKAKNQLYSGYVKGRVVTTGDAGTITGFNVIINSWESGTLALTKAKKGNKYTYARPRGQTGEITSASFDFDTATYMIKYSNADIGPAQDRELQIEFSRE